MPSIQEMRARMKSSEKKFDNDLSIYPFWLMGFNTSTNIRLLPWEDPVTGMLWTEKKVLPMEFVDNKDESAKVTYKAPSLEMYGTDKCPVTDMVRALYKEAKELKDNGDKNHEKIEKIAGKHWVDITYYYQGFVNNSAFKEENLPENTIRRIPFTKKIHKWLYSTLMDETADPFDIMPTGSFTVDDVRMLINQGNELNDEQVAEIIEKFDGYELILKKTKQGEYADYSTSSWKRGSKNSLTDEQVEAINKYGFHDLRSMLPERPTDEQYDVLVEMMSVSIARARGEDDGIWNPAWEEAGIKPWRAKNAKGEEKTSTTTVGSVADRVKANLKQDDAAPTAQTAKATSAASALADRLKKNRGAAQAEPQVETEVQGEAQVEAPVAETKAEPVANRVAALAQRVRANAAKA